MPGCTSADSDPICGVFVNGNEIGRTEFIKDCANPKFKTPIDLVYTPGRDLILSFRVFDLDYLSTTNQVLPHPRAQVSPGG